MTTYYEQWTPVSKMNKNVVVPEENSFLNHDGVKMSRLDICTNDVKLTETTNSSENRKFDPFVEREIDNPTTDCQTFSHLLKSTLGSGIMAMPYGFNSAGIVGGILGGVFLAAVCTHAVYILVACAHILYHKTKKKKMIFSEVVEAAFATGPEQIRKFAKFARYIVQIGIFTTYFGACSADNLIIATNYGQVIRYYTSESSVNATAATALAMVPVETALLRTIMCCLMLPLILLVWVPDLKYLASFSTLANFFMATVLGITFYYVAQNPLPISELSLTKPIAEFPKFFAITLFAMENIGIIMPLENNMKTPQNFLGKYGVLNRGMFAVTIIYLLIGVCGYMKYGENVNTIITANLPVTDIAAQIVKILIGSTVLLTFSLQFYVCRDMAWNGIKHHFPNHPLLAEYLLRTILVIACVSLAIAVPMIGPLVGLVGALGFSLLGIICPVMVESVTYWEIGYGCCNWRIYKNIFLVLLGILAMVFGSYDAIASITNM